MTQTHASVFSHIVRTRLSGEGEDVATEALAFILESSQAARTAMAKMLRRVAPDLPELTFIAQRGDGITRPDLSGLAGLQLHVLFENKFWAGLTDNQPMSYLRMLADGRDDGGLLVVVVPSVRVSTIWSELLRRVDDAGSVAVEGPAPIGFTRLAKTTLGPSLALTTWRQVIETLQLELTHDPARLADVMQLRALCDAADVDAHVPLSASHLSDQTTPARIIQLGSIVQAAVGLATERGIVNTTRLMPQASWDRIGRYLRFPAGGGVGAWLGTELRTWMEHGRTPLWLVFTPSPWSRADEVRQIVAPWANERAMAMVHDRDGRFSIGIDVPPGEEVPRCAESCVEQLAEIAAELRHLASRTSIDEDPAATLVPGG
jgi:hypothetical protein